MKKFNAKRVVTDGLLTAIALVIYVVELQIPIPLPVPGVKLGLSNIVTLFALFFTGPVDALLILLVKIFLGSLFSGNITAVLFSLGGGLLCYFVTILLKRLVTERQIWVLGVLGAIAHNIGQMIVAVVYTGTKEIALYLPVLILAAVFTGLFTGLAAQYLINAIKGHFDPGDKDKQP